MRRSQKKFTDVYDHPEDHESAVSQTWMVVTTQIVGVILIGAALLSLKTPTWVWLLRVGIPAVSLGFLALLVWAIYCWGDVFVSRARQLKNETYKATSRPFSTRNTKLLWGTFGLVLVDTALVTTVIVLTGGIGSPLDPLLGAIAIIAIATKQPFRTIVWALALFLFVVTVLTVLHAVYPLYGGWIIDGHGDPRFHLVFGAMVVSVTILSIVEYWISYETPHLLAIVPETVEAMLGDTEFESHVDELTRQITRGARSWIRWLSDRRLPLKDLSLVHDERAVIQQAVVLCLTYWIDETSLRQKRKIARNVTFQTLAAHWFDDHFDALAEHCPDKMTQERILRDSPAQLMNPAILRRSLPRLNELVAAMQKRAARQNRQYVRYAVTKILFGALVQHASSRDRFERLRDEYVQFLGEHLTPEQRELYDKLARAKRPLSVFLTAKVVMELLDSCRHVADTSLLIREAEFFNLLYSPILYYHDCEEELKHERYGRAFGDPQEAEKWLPSVHDLTTLVRLCEGLLPTIFGEEGLSAGRRAQLKLLLELYSRVLPSPLIAAYKRFLQHGPLDRPRIVQPFTGTPETPASETHAA